MKTEYWAVVSGGKDSVYMLEEVIFKNPDKYPLHGVLHYELEIDYPFIKNVMTTIKKQCEEKGIRYLAIKPRKTWKELYAKYGFPIKTVRWCNNLYKLDALRQAKAFFKKEGIQSIHYIGYCVDEEKRYQNKKKNLVDYPLVQEGIYENDILEWARKDPRLKSYYLVNTRCGCMYCPFMTRIAFAYLAKYYPDIYAEHLRMRREKENSIRKKKRNNFTLLGQNPKYDTDYLEKNIREKWLPILEQREKEAST